MASSRQRRLPAALLSILSAAALLAAAACGDHAAQAPTSELRAALTGPSIAVGPATLIFADATAERTESVTLANLGDAPLTVSAVETCAETPAAFTVAPVAPVTLQPGQTVQQAITYRPAGTDPGIPESGCLTVVSDDPASARVVVTFTAWRSTATACTPCHGDPARTPAAIAPAPPVGLAGSGETTTPGVGAHQAHLVAGRVSRPIACTECHPPFGPLHQNGKTDLAWGSLATGNGTFVPTYDGATCTNVACHGASLAGGTTPRPSWTKVDGTQAACGACHGLPPPLTSIGAAHPTATDCGPCHAGYTATSVNLATHVTGVVELCGGCSPPPCATCHATPPSDHVLAPAGGVGGTGDFETCIACHPGSDPRAGTVDAATHQNGVFDYDLGPTSCGVCHGDPPVVTSTGVTHTPSTTCGDCHAGYTSTTANPDMHLGGHVCLAGGCGGLCTACHGVPPATHVAAPAGSGGTGAFGDCSQCHAGYTPSTVNPATHQNGAVDAALGASSCGICHGAPPPLSSGQHPQDLSCGSCHSGYTATTVAPLCHRDGVTDCTPVPCASCHGNPPATTHLVSPAGSGGTGSFSSCTLCHPATSATISVTATHRNGVEDVLLGTASCATCHAAPPANTHLVTPAGSGGNGNFATCGTCHPGCTATTVNLATHRNGAEDVTLGATSCNICHGAPPPLSSGQHPQDAACGSCHSGYTATTVNLATHRDGSIDPPIECSMCHGIPPAGHVVAPAGSGGTGNFASCSQCHPGTSGGTVAATATHRNGVVEVTLAATSCAVCHGAPPPFSSAAHPAAPFAGADPAACGSCHTGYTATAVSPIVHRNGIIDLAVTCASCHGNPPALTSTGATHPASTACTGCHPDTSSSGWGQTATHRNGVVDVAQVPLVSVTPNPIAFGDVTAGSWRQLTLTVADTGTATLNVSGISRCSGTSSEFRISSTSAFSVAAGSSTTRTITYAPGGTGTDTGCFTLATNAGSLTVGVSGTGVSPRPIVSASPASLDFGAVRVESYRSLALTVSNPGTATLYVSGVSRCSGTSDEFRLSSTGGFSLSPGGSRQLTATYRPSGSGTDSGCVTISSNDPARGRLQVPVSGTGTR